MRGLPLRAYVEAGALIGLSAVLSVIKVFQMPNGGSVTAASMVPVLLIGLRWGPGLGLTAGAAYGLVQHLLGGYFLLPLQWLLDYPIAFGALGLTGYFRRRPLAGVATGITGRFVAHVVSGAVFFASYAPAGQSPWIYSAIYNGSYLLPELAISVIVAYLLGRTVVMQQMPAR